MDEDEETKTAHLDFDMRREMRSSASQDATWVGSATSAPTRQNDEARRDDVRNDRLADALFRTFGAAEVARTKYDRVCVSEMRERALCETFGPVHRMGVNERVRRYEGSVGTCFG